MKKISQRKLAQLAGVSQPYINKLIKNGVLPLRDGYLDEDECMAILRNKTHDQQSKSQDYTDFDRQYKKARAVKEARTAEIRGVDLKIKQTLVDIQAGKLLPKDELRNNFREFFIGIRQELYNMPNRTGISCAGQQPDRIQQIVQNEIDDYIMPSIDQFIESFRANNYK